MSCSDDPLMIVYDSTITLDQLAIIPSSPEASKCALITFPWCYTLPLTRLINRNGEEIIPRLITCGVRTDRLTNEWESRWMDGWLDGWTSLRH